jgi:hypothetical protein
LVTDSADAPAAHIANTTARIRLNFMISSIELFTQDDRDATCTRS